jgi:hypothetical protein
MRISDHPRSILRALRSRFANGSDASATVSLAPVPADAPRLSIPQVEILPPAELQRLNEMLPWASFVVDRHGRSFGKAWSSKKRAAAQPIPDRRIVELDRCWQLAGKQVLELGCFEGIHTIGLMQLGARVVAIDSRIENVVKTIVRCAMFGHHPLTFRWDVPRKIVALSSVWRGWARRSLLGDDGSCQMAA